jgi:hypothetical protein
MTVNVPKRLLAAGRPEIFAKTAAGFVSTWRVARDVPQGDVSTLTLVPRDFSDLPKLKDPGVFCFFDKATGQEHVGQFYVGVPAVETPPLIANGTFSYWNLGTSPALPSGWAKTGDADASFWAEPIPGVNSGLRFSVANLQEAPSATATLIQPVNVSPHVLRVRLRPFQDCTLTAQGGRVVTLAGVGIAAATGKRVIFCITSGRAVSVRRIGLTNDLVEMIPGRIRAWNDLTIDVRSIWSKISRGVAPSVPSDLEVVTSIGTPSNDHPWVTLDVASIEALH